MQSDCAVLSYCSAVIRRDTVVTDNASYMSKASWVWRRFSQAGLEFMFWVHKSLLSCKELLCMIPGFNDDSDVMARVWCCIERCCGWSVSWKPNDCDWILICEPWQISYTELSGVTICQCFRIVWKQNEVYSCQ